MSQYIIIFTNNDGLKKFYEHIDSEDQAWVDQKQMCFLPGDGSYTTFKNVKELPAADQSGVYLFYDGDRHDADYNKRDIIAALRQLKKQKNAMFLCYHIKNQHKIIGDIDELKIDWKNISLKRHHYQLPYTLLGDYYMGRCELSHLAEIWEQEETKQLKARRKELIAALDDVLKSKNTLELPAFHSVILAAKLNAAQDELLKEFIGLVKSGAGVRKINAAKEQFIQSLKSA